MKSSVALKSVIFTAGILLLSLVADAQVKSDNNKLEYKVVKFNTLVEVKRNEVVFFEDSLKVLLTSFSHKRPYVGGPTKATAHFTVSKGTIEKEMGLSIEGTEGKSEIESYETTHWNQYTFELKHFDYDSSIGLVISKK